jgi:hypothetical protein
MECACQPPAVTATAILQLQARRQWVLWAMAAAAVAAAAAAAVTRLLVCCGTGRAQGWCDLQGTAAVRQSCSATDHCRATHLLLLLLTVLPLLLLLAAVLRQG